jgi:hypothetical protein
MNSNLSTEDAKKRNAKDKVMSVSVGRQLQRALAPSRLFQGTARLRWAVAEPRRMIPAWRLAVFSLTSAVPENRTAAGFSHSRRS